MKNIIVANFQPKSKISKEQLSTYINAQIDNSLSLGWDRKDLILISNFEYGYNHVYAIEYDLNNICLTGSKMFGIDKLFDDIHINMILKDDSIWLHDLDVWQNFQFCQMSCPILLGEHNYIGICKYPTEKLAGGSIFLRNNYYVHKVVRHICADIIDKKANKEEAILHDVLIEEYDRNHSVCILNSTYNVGSHGFDLRIETAEKPVKCFHFHPEKNWNKFNIFIDKRLKNILSDHFKV